METNYFTVTLPSGNLVTKKAGKRSYTHAVVKGNDVLGWHVSEQRAKQDFVRRLAAEADLRNHGMTIERVRVA